jgi:hypothetical protein
MPPYPSGGTGSHGPAFISTVRVIGPPSGTPAGEADGNQRRSLVDADVRNDDLATQIGQRLFSPAPELGEHAR